MTRVQKHSEGCVRQKHFEQFAMPMLYWYNQPSKELLIVCNLLSSFNCRHSRISVSLLLRTLCVGLNDKSA
jgi:hypothetical protein